MNGVDDLSLLLALCPRPPESPHTRAQSPASYLNPMSAATTKEDEFTIGRESCNECTRHELNIFSFDPAFNGLRPAMTENERIEIQKWFQFAFSHRSACHLSLLATATPKYSDFPFLRASHEECVVRGTFELSQAAQICNCLFTILACFA